MPALPVGVYSLRVALLRPQRVWIRHRTQRRAVIAAVASATIGIFGEVPFSTLFNVSQNHVYTTPTGTFPWAFDTYDGKVNYTALAVPNNPCRSVHLTWVEGSEFDDSQQSGSVSLVQESADPVTASATGNSVGSLDATLVPGQSWSLNVAQVQNPSSEFLFTWYFNGVADCDTTQLVSPQIDPDGI